MPGCHPAIVALSTNQRQLDADGCEVGVSRQALDETLALLDALFGAANALSRECGHDLAPSLGAVERLREALDAMEASSNG